MNQLMLLDADLTNYGKFGIQSVNLETATLPKPSRLIGRKPRIVSPELLSLAYQNNILETVPRWEFPDQVKASSAFRQSLPELRDSFLNTHFCMFVDMGLNFESHEADIKRAVTTKVNAKASLAPYVRALHGSFSAFANLFAFMDYIIFLLKMKI